MAEEEKKSQEVEQAETQADESEDDVQSEDAGQSAPESKLVWKKILIPGIIAITALIAAFIVPMFLGGDEAAQEDPSVTEASHDTAALAEAEIEDRDSLMQEAAKPLLLSELSEEEMDELLSLNELFEELDTSAILEEMGMWGESSDKETEDGGMAPQDSLDTLSWIEHEMQKINAEKDSLETLKEELQKVENNVNQALERLDQAETTRITKLARLYDGMKPAEVARLFDNLPDSIIITIIPKMKPSNASKILGLIKPGRAAKISTKMITVMEP